MKKLLIKSGLITVILSLNLSACKDALDINIDPNNPSMEKGTPELTFPAGLASTVGVIGGEYAILGGIWAQFWTQSAVASQYRFIDSYNVSQSDFNRSFNELFSGALNDYHFTIEKSKEQENWKFFLMGTVMKAYTYQVLVDLYDMVPYDEAFQGSANLTPHFEDGYTVYQKLIAEIDTALSKDITMGPSPGTSDMIFEGDMDQWVRFANTLKLKMFLRMVYAQPQEAEAGIRSLFDNGALFLTSDASFTSFQDNPDKSNPLYEYNYRKLNINTNLRASRTFLTFLLENGDPRVESYFTKSGTSYAGINQGDYSNPDPALANVSVAVAKPTDPVQFISEAESYFLQAEALERYYGGNGAKDLYDAGVTAAFTQYGFGAQAAGFVSQGGAYEYPSAGTFEQKLEQIIVQKWASMPGSHALEAFFEKNRTGYPQSSAVYSTDPSYISGHLVYPVTGTTSGKYPKRLIFPESESKTNPNTPAIKSLTENVWWDKKL